MEPRRLQPINSTTPDPKSIRKVALHWLTKEELIELIIHMETKNEASLRAISFFNTKILARQKIAMSNQNDSKQESTTNNSDPLVNAYTYHNKG